jgi:hypothetical protein
MRVASSFSLSPQIIREPIAKLLLPVIPAKAGIQGTIRDRAPIEFKPSFRFSRQNTREGTNIRGSVPI